MKKAISILCILALLIALAVPVMAADNSNSDVSVCSWSTHSFSGTSASVTKSCSYASLTATYSDAFKSLTASTGEYKSSNYEQAISISFTTTSSRKITAYVSVGGGTIGIAS